MNQLVDLLDGALAANLSKRQWAAFAAVLRQTVGYRKTEDDLSARRLEQLTGIQRNHIWQAKNELVDMELINSRPGRYGEVLGLCPKTGGFPAQIRPESVPKRDTTLSNLTLSNHNSTSVGDNLAVDKPVETPAETLAETPQVIPPEDSNALDYPASLTPDERRQAPQKLDGLSPQAAQQVLAVWVLKIERGEVRKSRIGLLIALVNAQRNGTLNTESLPQSPAAKPTDPLQQQRLHDREAWLEQQAQQGWLRDMARLSGLPPDQFQQPGFTVKEAMP